MGSHTSHRHKWDCPTMTALDELTIVALCFVVVVIGLYCFQRGDL